MNDNVKPVQPRPYFKMILAVLGTILLGAIGSGLWEIVFRPGFNQAGGIITNISKMAEDAAYASAALDPRPLPSLLMLLIVCQIPLWMATVVFMITFIRKYIKNRISRYIEKNEDCEQRENRKQKVIYASSAVLLFILLTTYIQAYIGFSITNRALWIWRSHTANVAICSPYLDHEEIARINHKFRLIKTKDSYNHINSELSTIAAKYGFTLHNVMGESK